MVSGSKKIFSCTRGFFVGKTGNCEACATGCEICRSADMADCEKVKRGYQVITDLKSKRRKVVKCDANPNAGGTGIAHCDKCQIDKKLKANRCIECAIGKWLEVIPAVVNAQGV